MASPLSKGQPVVETHIMLSPIRKVAAARGVSQSAPKRPKKPMGSNLTPKASRVPPPASRKVLFPSTLASGSTSFQALDLMHTPQGAGNGFSSGVFSPVLTAPPNTPQKSNPLQKGAMGMAQGNSLFHGLEMVSGNLKRRRGINDVDGMEDIVYPTAEKNADDSPSSSSTLHIFEDDTAQPSTSNPWGLRDKQSAPPKKLSLDSSSSIFCPLNEDGETTPEEVSVVNTPTRTALSEKLVKGWIVNDDFQDDEAMWELLGNFGNENDIATTPSLGTELPDNFALLPFSTPEKRAAPRPCNIEEISPLSLPRSAISDKENVNPADYFSMKPQRRVSLPCLQTAIPFKKRRTKTTECSKPLAERYHSATVVERPTIRRRPAITSLRPRASLPDIAIWAPDHQESNAVENFGKGRTVLGTLNGITKAKTGMVDQQNEGLALFGTGKWTQTAEDDEMLL